MTLLSATWHSRGQGQQLHHPSALRSLNKKQYQSIEVRKYGEIGDKNERNS